jgi:outer membrane lipoprotein-sorting protein
MHKAPLFVVLTLLLCSSVCAQDALQVLKDASAHLSELAKSNYEFELLETHEFFTPMHIQTEIRYRITGSGGKYRQEMIPYGTIHVFDGQFKWTYMKNRNEYTKNPFSGGIPSGLVVFKMAGPMAKSARLLRQETLDFASGPVACQVIETENKESPGQMKPSNATYWVDAGRNLIVKRSEKYSRTDPHMTTPQEGAFTISITKAALGESVDQLLLQFVPPEGAVEVEAVTAGPKSPMIGSQAPDFELKGANGKAITSATLRGSLVLLYFGRQAEDDTLPLLEMLHRSLRSNGLTAIHVLPEGGTKANSANYTVSLAIDPTGAVAKKFGFNYQGEVLIDREG